MKTQTAVSVVMGAWLMVAGMGGATAQQKMAGFAFTGAQAQAHAVAHLEGFLQSEQFRDPVAAGLAKFALAGTVVGAGTVVVQENDQRVFTQLQFVERLHHTAHALVHAIRDARALLPKVLADCHGTATALL